MIEAWLMPLFAIFIFGFVVAVIIGGMRMTKENSAVRNNCVKTELVVIGNKGHKTPVYDCSNKEVDK
jgi:hypothetical protein